MVHAGEASCQYMRASAVSALCNATWFDESAGRGGCRVLLRWLEPQFFIVMFKSQFA